MCICHSFTHIWFWSCWVEENCWRGFAGSNISAKRRPAASCESWCRLSVTCMMSESSTETLNRRYYMYTQQEYFLKSQSTVCVFVIHTNRNSNVYSVIFTSIWPCNFLQNRRNIIWPLTVCVKYLVRTVSMHNLVSSKVDQLCTAERNDCSLVLIHRTCSLQTRARTPR